MTGPRHRPTLRVTRNGLNGAYREEKYGSFFLPYPVSLQTEKLPMRGGPWTPRARVVYDQVSNDRMEQSAKDSIQKPPVKESEALLASEIGTGTPSGSTR